MMKRTYHRPGKPTTGPTVTGASAVALLAAAGGGEPSRQRQVSGPVFFGFGIPAVQQAIQQMPGADKLLCNIDAKVGRPIPTRYTLTTTTTTLTATTTTTTPEEIAAPQPSVVFHLTSRRGRVLEMVAVHRV